jgi:Flp pilus assembly protein TadD
MARSSRRPTGAPEAGVASAPWLVSPAVDLVVGAGGWTLPLLALTAAAAWSGADTAPLFYALALVCNWPHYMATVARAYASPEVRARHRGVTVWVTGALVALAAATPWSPWLTRGLVTTYLTWSPWHYTGQNFGIAVLFARRAGIDLAPAERRVLRAAFVASFVMWLLWMQGTPPVNPDVLSLGIAPALAVPARLAALAVFVVTAMMTTVLLARRAGRAAAPVIALLTTQALWFVVPTLPGTATASALGAAYFSGGVLAFAHCAQYLWIASYAARRETPGFDGARYATLLVVGGAALFVPVPWLASRLAPIELTRALLVVAAAVNVHHFVLDGVLWRLRDARVARTLGAVAAGRVPARPSPARRRPPAWAWVTATVVLAIAGLDQLQYWLTRPAAGPEALAAAVRLQPHDARALMRRAETLAAGGQTDQALGILDDILVLDPLAAPALRKRGSLLVQAGRLADAAAHYDLVQQRINPDLTTLVNAGVLAARRGDLEGARVRLEQAIALDPTNAEAYLDLAEVDMLRGDAAAAVPQYETYLALAETEVARDPARRPVVDAARARLAAARAARTAR